MWGNAINIWKARPFFGAGPGRFGFEYLKVEPQIPPSFWPTHAHGLFFQVLAEFGLVGCVCFLLLVVSGIIGVWKCYQMSTETKWEPWARAIVAGAAGWLLQMVTDDQTTWIAIMVPLILLMAWLVTARKDRLKRWLGMDMKIYWIPAIMHITVLCLGLWAYYPMVKGLSLSNEDDWIASAEMMEQSADRDPNLSFYATEAGLGWSVAWQNGGGDYALSKACELLSHSLTLESAPSFIWANLAVLNWYVGEEELAIERMSQAMKASSREPSYPLNLGWFLEQTGDQDGAAASYLEVLNRAPGWSSHPFWKTSETRSNSLDQWLSDGGVTPNEQNEYYWEKSLQAIDDGDLLDAENMLMRGEWVGESQLALSMVGGELAEAKGEIEVALAEYEELVDLVIRRTLNSYAGLYNVYSLWLNHLEGVKYDLVPGYVQLDVDIGQFETIEHLVFLYSQIGECEKANDTWHILQGAIRGGSIDFEAEPLPFPCQTGNN